MYEKVHEAIREDPSRDAVPKFTNIDKSFKKARKLTYEQRKERSNAKKAELKAAQE